jgi:hypothetical protein
VKEEVWRACLAEANGARHRFCNGDFRVMSAAPRGHDAVERLVAPTRIVQGCDFIMLHRSSQPAPRNRAEWRPQSITR